MRPRIIGLSEREREVLCLLATGASNQEIADALVVARRTIVSHVRQIMVKKNCYNRVRLALHAVKSGLISLDEIQLDEIELLQR